MTRQRTCVVCGAVALLRRSPGGNRLCFEHMCKLDHLLNAEPEYFTPKAPRYDPYGCPTRPGGVPR